MEIGWRKFPFFAEQSEGKARTKGSQATDFVVLDGLPGMEDFDRHGTERLQFLAIHLDIRKGVAMNRNRALGMDGFGRPARVNDPHRKIVPDC